MKRRTTPNKYAGGRNFRLRRNSAQGSRKISKKFNKSETRFSKNLENFGSSFFEILFIYLLNGFELLELVAFSDDSIWTVTDFFLGIISFHNLQ